MKYCLQSCTLKRALQEGAAPVAIYPGTRESIIGIVLFYFARLGEFSYENGRPGYRLRGGLWVFVLRFIS